MNSLGIYIHVPFCGRKCRYCDFYSVCYSKQQAESYCRAVLRNIRHYADKNTTVDTVYFGGGTPTLLSAEQIAGFIGEIKNCFNLAVNAEITIEANPCTLTPKKLSELREAGINRLSVGVQSLNSDELDFLGRTHTAERAIKAVLDAEKAGFNNISCDLMIALPGQTAEKLKNSIDILTSLPVNHISAYILKIEENTPFNCPEIRDIMPDDDKTADLYLTMVDELKQKGFSQYEVSNFARQGFESRHNCRYWKCLDYLGIGPASHSCFMGKRFAVKPDLQAFIDSPVQPVEITDESPCGFEEYAMLRLRLAEGLNLSDVESHRSDIVKKITPLLRAGYIKYDGENIALTETGFLMSNSVIEYLIF
ncbi:MAG: radical SAM family heme chaperone HemW [Ruminococcus flavefaciens]|nr:radical SAM family heme chaperone HemW [Ruminococcus flavefaciens]MCM1229773.1 radical SAM family heme chaperone HemW [Ruminococcus flavefaciens]